MKYMLLPINLGAFGFFLAIMNCLISQQYLRSILLCFPFITLLRVNRTYKRSISNYIESITLLKGNSVAEEVLITSILGESKTVKIEKIKKQDYKEFKWRCSSERKLPYIVIIIDDFLMALDR